ncbi:MAG: DUF983 domain-containing protein, partial [Dehalococcoidia bacterium]
LQGRVFSGVLDVAAACPVCRLSFQREPGYFAGAAYFGYGLSVGQVAPTLFVLLWLGFPDGAVLGFALGQLILLSPLTFRYARILWLHFDQVVGLSRG